MLSRGLLSIFGLLSLMPFVASNPIVGNLADLPHTNFDFIVVGGGTAGNVIANRLTENPNFQVLVIEAGPTHEGLFESEVPWLAANLFGTQYDWNYTTVPQEGLAGRTVAIPRGHVLGGSSSINFMIYTRSAIEDYDRWANLTGDQGWSWDNLMPYFKKTERFTASADSHDTAGQFNSSVHGFNGYLSTSISGFPTPIDQKVIQASQELGGDFKYNLDVNSGDPIGIAYIQTIVDGPTGTRGSSAAGFLAPSILKRPNLHVLVNARVSRLIQTTAAGKGTGAWPAFRGVEFQSADSDSLNQLTASKEVILSAGSIESPHILLNSGIGSTQTLKGVGIDTLVDLPDVGQNLVDHSVMAHPFIVSGTDTFEKIRDPANVPGELQLWNETRGGPMVDTIASMLGFFRIPDNVTLDRDDAAGPNAPHFEHLIANGLIVPNAFVPANASFFSMSTVVTSPVSRGNVTINSTDPFAYPLIDPGLLREQPDRVVMKESIKHMLKFVTAPVFDGYILSPSGGLENVHNDEDLDAYVTAASSTFFHPVGSLAMSSTNATTGCVDPDLRLKKVLGVRVVDASIFPFIPTGHTSASVYVVAERASDLIKKTYPQLT